MESMSLQYWNTLASQIIAISSLLGGFSIAVIANLLVSNTNTRLSRTIMKASVLAASFFLVSLFAMTNVIMMTTEGFPLEMTQRDLNISSIIGGLTLFLGILSLITMISLSGWTKSKAMGKFTTIAGTITLIMILFMLL